MKKALFLIVLLMLVCGCLWAEIVKGPGLVSDKNGLVIKLREFETAEILDGWICIKGYSDRGLAYDVLLGKWSEQDNLIIPMDAFRKNIGLRVYEYNWMNCFSLFGTGSYLNLVIDDIYLRTALLSSE